MSSNGETEQYLTLVAQWESYEMQEKFQYWRKKIAEKPKDIDARVKPIFWGIMQFISHLYRKACNPYSFAAKLYGSVFWTEPEVVDVEGLKAKGLDHISHPATKIPKEFKGNIPTDLYDGIVLSGVLHDSDAKPMTLEKSKELMEYLKSEKFYGVLAKLEHWQIEYEDSVA